MRTRDSPTDNCEVSKETASGWTGSACGGSAGSVFPAVSATSLFVTGVYRKRVGQLRVISTIFHRNSISYIVPLTNRHVSARSVCLLSRLCTIVGPIVQQ